MNDLEIVRCEDWQGACEAEEMLRLIVAEFVYPHAPMTPRQKEVWEIYREWEVNRNKGVR